MIVTTDEQKKALRAAGKILAGVLSDVGAMVKDGVSCAELDLAAEHAIRTRGAVPAFLGYTPAGSAHPYPATLCVSINDEVVHGLPHAEKILRNGDIVTLDAGLSYNGYFVDAARTLIVGSVVQFETTGEKSLAPSTADPQAHKLVSATHEALQGAIAAARVGGRVGDIGAAIVRVARKYNLTPVEELGGHGVGESVHEKPFIPNSAGAGEGEVLKEGMVLAIEPMLAEGKGAIILDKDQWTYRMRDRKRAAHFEDTVILGKNGPEVLTA